MTEIEKKKKKIGDKKGYRNFKPILWKRNEILKTLKELFNALMDSAMMYVVETWTIKVVQKKNLLAKEMNYKRRAGTIPCLEKKQNYRNKKNYETEKYHHYI